MHIKQINIEGFKSYGNKVVLNNLDTTFNAITGLNGTGKSNILDSICFVLGLSKLEQVRASNLDDLVYNRGASGLTKAEVSIVFDNSVIEQSPIGYENVLEITVTRIVALRGGNKYFLNGVNTTRRRLHDFFQSVQLNINNPHFLIQQGRITKILNMKPKEILAMIEETTGGRMLDDKIHLAANLISKKDKRIGEMDQMVSTAILPQIEELRKNSEEAREYQRAKSEYDILSKQLIAWQYMQEERNGHKAHKNIKLFQEELNSATNNIKNVKEKISHYQAKIKELDMKKNNEEAEKMEKLEENLKNKTEDDIKVKHRLVESRKQLDEDRNKQLEFQNLKEKELHLLMEKEKNLMNSLENIKQFESVLESETAAYELAIKRLEDAKQGVYTTSTGESESLAAQLMTAQTQLSMAETEEHIAKNKLSYLQGSLKQNEADFKDCDDNFESIHLKFKQLENEVKLLEQTVRDSYYDEKILQDLKRERNRTEVEVRNLQEIVDTINTKFPLLSFDYCDPVKNFDRNKVKGVLCTLFKVRDPSTSTALEIAAGVKLFFVVVNDEVTGKLLLERGQLKKRRTLIPLNKIISHRIPDRIVKKAQELVGPDNIFPALSAIEYEDEMAVAMEYVFGGIFLARDMESARTIAFESGLTVKCITLDGEVFDSAGTVSGGSVNHRNPLLNQLCEMKSIQEKLLQKQQHSLHLVTEINKAELLHNKYMIMKQKLTDKKQDLERYKIQVEGSSYYQLKEEIRSLNEAIKDQKSVISKAEDTVKTAKKSVSSLQDKMKDVRFQERTIQKAKGVVDTCEKNKELSEKQLNSLKDDHEKLLDEIGEIKETVADFEKKIIELVQSIEKQTNQIKNIEEEVKIKKNLVSKALEELKTQRELIKQQNTQITKYTAEIRASKSQLTELVVRKQQLEIDINKCSSAVEESNKKMKHYVKTYHWITNEKQYFGVPNTDYDFDCFDERSKSKRHEQLQTRINELSKSIWPRVQRVYDNADKQLETFLMHKTEVLKEKGYICDTINHLDEMKKISVLQAYEKISQNLSSIFSTLLPGAKIKLVPHDGVNVLNGLDFKVGFGNIWKDSLLELSGGQRVI